MLLGEYIALDGTGIPMGTPKLVLLAGMYARPAGVCIGVENGMI
jgi:hypothetical protein